MITCVRILGSLDTVRAYWNSTEVAMGRSEQEWRSEILSRTSNGNSLSGRVFKDGGFWLAELPALDVVTQGKTRRDAYAMVKDLLETLVDTPGVSAHVEPVGDGGFEVSSNGIGKPKAA